MRTPIEPRPDKRGRYVGGEAVFLGFQARIRAHPYRTPTGDGASVAGHGSVCSGEGRGEDCLRELIVRGSVLPPMGVYCVACSV